METLEFSIKPARVTFPSGAITLTGDIWQPPLVKPPLPIVIWNHSTGGREDDLFVDGPKKTSTLELLLSMGFAVFAPIRRDYNTLSPGPYVPCGTDSSTKNRDEFVSQRIKDEAEDVTAAIAFTQTLNWVDHDRVMCFGHAFGAMASLVAAKNNGNLQGMVLQR